MGTVKGREPFRWHSTISYKTVPKIVTRGYDTTELVEKGYGFADVIFINYQARIPLIKEVKMLHYLMILCLDDGMSTSPSIARFVAKGHNILTQSAGASILAFGNAYGAFQTYGRMLDRYLERVEQEGKSHEEMAEILVKENHGSLTLGVSNLMLKDPAAKRISARADSLDISGRYIAFQKEIVKAAQKASKEPVDLDMLGAVGATMFDLGFTPEATWSIVALARAFGSTAHALEEEEREPRVVFGQNLQPKEYYDGPPDRPVPSLKDRGKVVRPAQTKSLEEWRKTFDERAKLRGSGWAIVEEIADPRKLVSVKDK
ncbi:MAG: citrate/2-methylcitrate synthase [Thermodesulfobacteriota bacterium]